MREGRGQDWGIVVDGDKHNDSGGRGEDTETSVVGGRIQRFR